MSIVAATKDNATITMWIAGLAFLLSALWCIVQPIRPRNVPVMLLSMGLLFLDIAFIILQGVKLT